MVKKNSFFNNRPSFFFEEAKALELLTPGRDLKSKNQAPKFLSENFSKIVFEAILLGKYLMGITQPNYLQVGVDRG